MKSKSSTNSFFLVSFLCFLLAFLPVRTEASKLYQVSGNITVLRINALGSGYGSKQDFIDGEVIIKLNSHPDSAYGFQLRNTDERPVREAMFALLRDAYKNNWKVTIDYWKNQGKKNGIIHRMWLTK